MRIRSENRDTLARIAEQDFGGASLDETVARLTFEHESFAALGRLSDEQLRDYANEHRALAEADMGDPDVTAETSDVDNTSHG